MFNHMMFSLMPFFYELSPFIHKKPPVVTD